jgi:hypothetical protein
MSVPLNCLADTREATTGVVFGGPFFEVSIPFRTTPALSGILDYLGTNRNTATFTNPLYTGVRFGTNGKATGKVKVGSITASTSFSGVYSNVEDLADKILTVGVSSVMQSLGVVFDFCSCTTQYTLAGQTIIDNCLVSLSGCAYGATSSGSGGPVSIQGSNDGINWTTLNSGMSTTAGVISYFSFPNNNQFYRYIRFSSSAADYGEVEFFGTIRFIQTL